jgi:hydantoinase/carbamoylase family amidase
VGLLALTGEEATAYGTSTFGSRALAGLLPDVAANLLPDGRTVREGLAAAGGRWEGLSGTGAALGPLACFLEVHIEQGTRLERQGRPLGVVSGVSGIHRQRMVFRGEPGHAGTLAMRGRRDALRAAARFVLTVADLPATVAGSDPDATATVGFLEVVPNAPNVVPGEVTASTDLRSRDPHLLARLAGAAEEAARGAAAAEGAGVAVAVLLDQAPVTFDPTVRRAMAGAIGELGVVGPELVSLAGHDAVHMGSLAPAGMLFVRCAGGLSHRPDESMTPADAALAAEALLRTVLALDRALQPDGEPRGGG